MKCRTAISFTSVLMSKDRLLSDKLLAEGHGLANTKEWTLKVGASTLRATTWPGQTPTVLKEETAIEALARFD